MGKKTHEYTQNYFQKYKCKLLTPQVKPFRNLIATLYSLLSSRLIFLLESKNAGLSPSTIFCKYIKPCSTEISSSSDGTFLMKRLQKCWSYISCLFIKNRKKDFHPLSVFIAEVSQGSNYSSGMKVICGLFLNHLCTILHSQSCDKYLTGSGTQTREIH